MDTHADPYSIAGYGGSARIFFGWHDAKSAGTRRRSARLLRIAELPHVHEHVTLWRTMTALAPSLTGAVSTALSAICKSPLGRVGVPRLGVIGPEFIDSIPIAVTA